MKASLRKCGGVSNILVTRWMPAHGRNLRVRFYLMTASRKKLYWDTLEVLLPAPLYRTVPAPQCASGLFKQVRKLPVPATSKDFFVRLHLGVLPVKVWLDDRGLFVPWSTNCDLCGANETLPHVFVECSNAYLFWDEMRKDLGVDFPVDWHVFRYLDVEGTDTASSMVLPSMVLLGLHAIWLARSAMVECQADVGLFYLPVEMASIHRGPGHGPGMPGVESN
ncbi:unnamed protein product [Ixodes pacificus]